jgi:cell division septum initiation protein DivIVA
MTRRESENPEVTENAAVVPRKAVDFDVQQQLAELQELLYDSFHIPLTAWSVVDEEKILDHIDIIAEFIPGAVQRAIAILEREQQILDGAEAESQRVIEMAYQEAQRIKNESGIIQKAQQEADQYKAQIQHDCDALQRQVQQDCDVLQRQTQQECETLKRQTLSELEQIKQVTHQEIQQFRQQTVQECETLQRQTEQEATEMQRDVDTYADRLLSRLEGELAQMVRSVSQSRQILYENSAEHNASINNRPVVSTPVNNPSPSPAPKSPRGDRPRRRSR